MANVVLSDKKDYKNPSYRRAGKHFEEKKHSLIIDSQGASNKEVKTESGTLKFENGVAMLPNDSRAKDVYDELQGSTKKEVKALHPNQYSLIRGKPTVNTDETHRYYFGSQPAMPWARYDELGRRLPDPDIKEEQDARPNEPGSRYGDPDSGTQLLHPSPREV